MIEKISLKLIDDFNNHPFKVIEDESLKELADSINENGLLEPLVVRRKENRRYEMLSGHRRKKALELIGTTEAICNIEDLLDEEATILMVDSNIYREKIFPSEKAFAYKMKLEAIKHQGKKSHFCTTCAEVNLGGVNSKSKWRIKRTGKKIYKAYLFNTRVIKVC